MMDWKEAAEEVRRNQPEWGRRRLYGELKRRGYTMGSATVGRWLEKARSGSTRPEDVHRARRELDRLRKQIAEQEQQQREESALNDIWRGLSADSLKPPAWTAPRRARAGQSILMAALGDTHFDEVVSPFEIENLNAYNRQIAEQRIKKYFSNVVQIGRDYLHNVDINGLVLGLLGDMVSGTIHEELAETNEAHIIPSCLHWTEQLAAGIELLAKQFGRIHVAGVVGNHGRTTKKPRSKGRVEDNFDFLIYALLAKHFADIPEITVQVPTGADLDVEVYGSRYRLTHGDQFRGGSGIAGALSPMMIGQARKSKNAAAAKRPFDYLVMGHWHQYYDFKRIIACGCIKGFDEYGYTCNLEYEEPSGAFWLHDSKKGRTIRGQVHVKDKSEKWETGTDKTTPPEWMNAS